MFLTTSYIVKRMNYTINSGGTSITEGNPITILSDCGNGITIKEFDIIDFLFNSDNEGIACCVNDKKIRCERLSNTFILLNKPFTIDLDFSISFFNMKQVSTFYLTMAFMTSSSSFLLKKLSQKSVATTSFDQVTIYSEANRDSDIGRESNVSKEIDLKKLKVILDKKLKFILMMNY